MRSDIYELESLESDFAAIPAEAEKVAVYNGLDKKSALRLRLLAEELICMLPRLLIYGKGRFWIESRNNEFELHLQVAPNDASAFDTEKVLAVSTSGRNASAKGILGKIMAAFEQMVSSREKMLETDPYGVWSTGLCDYDERTIWSLKTYKNGFEDESMQKDHAEEWDELEKSVIANLADDVTVGVLNGKVDMVVRKKF